MSALEIALLASTAYFAGLTLWLGGALHESSPLRCDELAALALWPLSIPVLWAISTVKRHRRTCSTCHGRFATIDDLRRHQEHEGHR